MPTPVDGWQCRRQAAPPPSGASAKRLAELTGTSAGDIGDDRRCGFPATELSLLLQMLGAEPTGRVRAVLEEAVAGSGLGTLRRASRPSGSADRIGAAWTQKYAEGFCDWLGGGIERRCPEGAVTGAWPCAVGISRVRTTARLCLRLPLAVARTLYDEELVDREALFRNAGGERHRHRHQRPPVRQ